MRWPGEIASGKICSEPAMTIDLLPSIAEITGTSLPKNIIDGKSIWSLMKGEGKVLTKPTIFIGGQTFMPSEKESGVFIFLIVIEV